MPTPRTVADLPLHALRALPGVATFAFDHDLRITLAEGHAFAEAGWDAEKIVGRSLLEVLPPAALNRLEAPYRAALAGERSAFDYEAVTVQRAYSVDVAPMHDDSGAIAGGVVVVRDRTREWEAETALRDRENHFRLLAEHASDVVTRQRLDATYTWVSPSIEPLLGYRPEELLGHTSYELFHPDDVPGLRASHERLLRGEDFVRATYRLRHKRGHWVWVEANSHLVRDADGEPVEVVIARRDVTEQMAMEAALRASEARARSIVGAVPVALVVHDADGAVRTMNAAAHALLGRSAAELHLRGMAATDHLVTADGAPLPRDRHPALVALRTGHEVQDPDLGVRGPGGQVRWTVVRAQPTSLSESDTEAAVVVSYADVTSLREAQLHLERTLADLQRRTEELARSNADLDRFATIASHDLASPLIVARGHLELAAGRDLDERAAEHVSAARSALDRMQELLSSLLAWARLDRSPPERVRVDLGEIAGEVVALRGAELAAAGGRLEHSELPVVRGDRVLIRQVLDNLVGNAIKHSGGAAPLVEVSCEPDDDGWWRVEVRDHGPGVPEGARERIFELFERGDGPDRPAGHGIGLATARRIVERLGGRIWVEAADGGGSRFCLTLPRA